MEDTFKGLLFHRVLQRLEGLILPMDFEHHTGFVWGVMRHDRLLRRMASIVGADKTQRFEFMGWRPSEDGDMILFQTLRGENFMYLFTGKLWSRMVNFPRPAEDEILPTVQVQEPILTPTDEGPVVVTRPVDVVDDGIERGIGTGVEFDDLELEFGDMLDLGGFQEGEDADEEGLLEKDLTESTLQSFFATKLYNLLWMKMLGKKIVVKVRASEEQVSDESLIFHRFETRNRRFVGLFSSFVGFDFNPEWVGFGPSSRLGGTFYFIRGRQGRARARTYYVWTIRRKYYRFIIPENREGQEYGYANVGIKSSYWRKYLEL